MSEERLARLRADALAGALAQAARGLEELDRDWPQADVAALRAWVALAQGEDGVAARWLDATFARAPDHREALTLAIELARRGGRDEEALALARRMVALEPRSALAHFNLGALLERGDAAAARAAFDVALAIEPRFAPALRARAWLRFDAGDAAAADDFRALSRVDPGDPSAALGLGAGALRGGEPGVALAHFDHARRLAPADPSALHGRADALERLGREAESLAARRAVVALAGGDPAARCQYAMALSRAGEAEAARAEAAAAADVGGGPLAAWLALQLLPVVYRDDADIARWRAHWRAGLQAFDAATARIAPADALAVLDALPSFYRHYLDDDLLGDQRAAGALVGRLAHAALPTPRHRAAPRAQGRLRVGFASAHFERHTVGSLFGGLVRGLDRSRFEVLAFHLGGAASGRAAALSLADAAIGPLHALPAWVDALQAAELDALVWLDIGMDGTTQALSALRFAPLQAMLWGHPVTSGLDAIDLFIGAQGMAPADPAARYSERFVALPGIGITLAAPVVPAAAPGTGGARLLCAQGIHKLLPLHDATFARILAAVPDATLDLLPGAAEPLRARLEARLRGSCGAHGVDFERRVRVHPRLSDADFRARLAQADLVLDSFGWSGGWTSLQALAAGLPVLTCPGPGLRARHSLAFVDRIGMADELVVPDADAYVARAVELAIDAPARRALAARLRPRAGLLFDDPAPAVALGERLWRECGR
jgi:predicted O-linked N-acetylglucosamine transferase (SPINDLY family)